MNKDQLLKVLPILIPGAGLDPESNNKEVVDYLRELSNERVDDDSKLKLFVLEKLFLERDKFSYNVNSEQITYEKYGRYADTYLEVMDLVTKKEIWQIQLLYQFCLLDIERKKIVDEYHIKRNEARATADSANACILQ